METMRQDAMFIIESAIKDVLPQEAVKKALQNKHFSGNVVLIAIGKAAWTMASAANEICSEHLTKGIVITKYGHSNGEIGNLKIMEAGHPLPDENSIIATEEALKLVQGLSETDTVLFLISGGGSALFEKPLDGVSLVDILQITEQLLGCGANIVEINTIRKHLSSVKGGRFAQQCCPAYIFAVVLSDVIGDRLDSIASGPAYADNSTSKDAEEIINKYNIMVPHNVLQALKQETPKKMNHCETIITGSVSQLCLSASRAADKVGYKTMILSSQLGCEAKEAGKFLGSIAKTIRKENFPLKPPCAIICGGETVVHMIGKGKGGRNQELALSSAQEIDGLKNTILVAVGSDGTDGPTDAAGGIVDWETKKQLEKLQIDIEGVLKENNSYEALKAVDCLVKTGSTGTNVNDLYFLLCR